MNELENINDTNNWFDLFERKCPRAKTILIGSKMDLINEKEKLKKANEIGEKIALERGCIAYIPTSSKTSENVDNSIIFLVKSILANMNLIEQPELVLD